MPRCDNCKTMLPPDFLTDTDDGLGKKCLFCNRFSSTIEYFSESENKTLTVNKADIEREYQEFLREISSLPSINDIVDSIKNKEKSSIVI